MADAVATQTIQDGAKTAIFRFTNVSDGTGESAVTKIDVSSLSNDPMTDKACSSVVIEKIYYQTMNQNTTTKSENLKMHFTIRKLKSVS